MSATSTFKLTYSTMFDPPAELHTRFEEALDRVKSELGREHGMVIAGEDRLAAEKFESRSPADAQMVLGVFQKGTPQDAQAAIAAARQAFPGWSRTPWQERVALMRRAADVIDRRVFEIGVAMALEVGKNRMEALGDAAETADLIRYACYQMEKNNGYVVEMERDPLVGYTSRNVSALRPYGVWVVISPFNFPAALSGGPASAALAAGNTVVLKPASDTPWTPRLLAECFREAGLPAGVFNFITGPGSAVGQALVESFDVDGITFTGSWEVGMRIYRQFTQGCCPRPAILEMGGKNPAIVSRHADLERAALGITRSAFGLQGQKCSACSRVFAEAPVYDELLERMAALTNKLVVGDPTQRGVYMGPVINQKALSDYRTYTEELSQAGRFLTGGQALTSGDYARGYFCPPTIVADVPLDHRLWEHEMFLPIMLVHKVDDLDGAMRLANQVNYGLTAGFYGSPEEVEWFFEHIQAGVTYANRPHGATTGAWPGYQPFGGWKGSGSTGKNAGGHYYLPLYMREQIRTRVE